jgi:uncharacterized membrane protein
MPVTAASIGLFLHIVTSFWLVAGVFGATVVRAQAKRASDLRERVAVMKVGARLATIFTIPGGILAGLLGFWLVTARGWGFQPGWVKASAVIYLFMLATGLGYISPRMRALVRAGEASVAAGGPTPEYQRLAANKLPAILADVNALGIVVLTLLMTLKPF